MEYNLDEKKRRVKQTISLTAENAEHEEFQELIEKREFSRFLNILLDEYRATGKIAENSIYKKMMEEIRELKTALNTLTHLIQADYRVSDFIAYMAFLEGSNTNIVKAVEKTRYDHGLLMSGESHEEEMFEKHEQLAKMAAMERANQRREDVPSQNSVPEPSESRRATQPPLNGGYGRRNMDRPSPEEELQRMAEYRNQMIREKPPVAEAPSAPSAPTAEQSAPQPATPESSTPKFSLEDMLKAGKVGIK